MVVLALETVTRAGSVALFIDGTCASSVGNPSRTHAERLPGELIALLRHHGRDLRDVDLLAVITGPGSFTGLRVGIAAIQGLSIASGRPIVPVPTLDAMALAWRGANLGQTSAAAVVVACLDGHRSEVFSAGWRFSNSGLLSDAEPVMAARVGSPADVAADVRALAKHSSVVVVGDGPRKYAATFEGIDTVDLPLPLAEVAARQAAAHPHLAVAPHALRPVYIRRPDAVLARERSNQAAGSSS